MGRRRLEEKYREYFRNNINFKTYVLLLSISSGIIHMNISVYVFSIVYIELDQSKENE
jgi:hypothetical protein